MARKIYAAIRAHTVKSAAETQPGTIVAEPIGAEIKMLDDRYTWGRVQARIGQGLIGLMSEQDATKLREKKGPAASPAKPPATRPPAGGRGTATK